MSLKGLIETYKDMSLDEVTVEEVLDDLQELESLYKPEDVPQYVANWYEENKSNLEIELFCAISETLEHNKEGKLSKFEKWLIDSDTEPFKTLVNMQQFGYTVSKATKYTVKFKFIKSYLNLDTKTDEWFPANKEEIGSIKTKFTKEELESYDLDVFYNPMFEVEEVEE